MKNDFLLLSLETSELNFNLPTKALNDQTNFRIFNRPVINGLNNFKIR